MYGVLFAHLSRNLTGHAWVTIINSFDKRSQEGHRGLSDYGGNSKGKPLPQSELTPTARYPDHELPKQHIPGMICDVPRAKNTPRNPGIPEPEMFALLCASYEWDEPDTPASRQTQTIHRTEQGLQ
ncbi:hypothetical protein ElyMa_002055500 [Elysia marginata]|uniref:Uncharacterized protein n=1 Tax=Elysia marginata TaxID=1093978 RepID=A0AAV4F8H0_9GAST|nr:hypothetical protein ElyMa_002055500 [Elysia marginata]